MKILTTCQEVRDARNQAWKSDHTIGFVPTMGALHQGHLELIRRAKKENSLVIASIFVNPTQFNDPQDLAKYPRMPEKDQELLQSVECDYLFYPTPEIMYPDQYRYKITETEFSKKLCGGSRPGHFDGVLTIVMKLLQLTYPHRAYFGEKDYQQLDLIQGMVSAFFMDTEIVPCPTVRESDGLAMSSRNMRLTAMERELAPNFYRVLLHASSDEVAKQELSQLGFKVDYVETHSNRRYGAIFLGSVRLIDNVPLRVRNKM